MCLIQKRWFVRPSKKRCDAEAQTTLAIHIRVLIGLDNKTYIVTLFGLSAQLDQSVTKVAFFVTKKSKKFEKVPQFAIFSVTQIMNM